MDFQQTAQLPRCHFLVLQIENTVNENQMAQHVLVIDDYT